jgi:hypothetical protein
MAILPSGTVVLFNGMSIQARGPADLAPQELKSRQVSKNMARIVFAEFILTLLMLDIARRR